MDPVAVFQDMIDGYLAAYAAHDAVSCAALYAEDGEVHSPFAPPALGRAEIAEEHRSWFEEGETNKRMQVTQAGIDGSLGFCFVEFTADLPGEHGGTATFHGTSLNVMERRSDGHWTIKLTSLNGLVEQETESDR